MKYHKEYLQTTIDIAKGIISSIDGTCSAGGCKECLMEEDCPLGQPLNRNRDSKIYTYKKKRLAQKFLAGLLNG